MSGADTFFAAAKRADVAELRRLLSVDPALARARDAGGRTVLHHLACASDGAGGDPRGAEASAAAALNLLRAHDVALDDVNPKTGTPTWLGASCHLALRAVRGSGSLPHAQTLTLTRVRWCALPAQG
jgi:hypothetical protein